MTTTGDRVLDAGTGEQPGRLDAVHAGHPDVEQAHVRAQPPGQLDGLAPVGGLADDLDAGLRVEDHRQPGADDLLVVRDERRGRSRAAPRAAARRSTVQPPPGSGPASNVPPSRSARSRHADQAEPGRPGRRPALALAVVADPSGAPTSSSAATRTSIRVACRAWRRALVTDSCASR